MTNPSLLTPAKDPVAPKIVELLETAVVDAVGRQRQLSRRRRSMLSVAALIAAPSK